MKRVFTQFSPDANAWLKAAIDPFHDQPLKLAGYPDSETAPVVVQSVTQTLAVTKPGVVGATDTWDCHIFSLPYACVETNYPGTFFDAARITDGYYDAEQLLGANTIGSAPITPTTSHLNFATNPEASYIQKNPYTMSLLNVHAGKRDFRSIPDGLQTTGFVGTDFDQISITLPPTATAGRRRLIAQGFEVTNVTPDIYKSGTVTAYRVPQSRSEFHGVSSDMQILSAPVGTPPKQKSPLVANDYTGWSSGLHPRMFDKFSLPPADISAAMSYSGSLQWAAKDGAYVVCRLSDIENPMRENERKTVMFAANDQSTLPTNTQALLPLVEDCRVMYSHTQQAGSTADDRANFTYHERSAPGGVYTPFDTSGVFLTGLSPQTVLTITYKQFWEIAPRVNDKATSALVYTTQPSAYHDPEALEAYSRIASLLPVAVPVRENALGDWFRRALSVGAAVVPHIAHIAPLISAINPAWGNVARSIGRLAGNDEQGHTLSRPNNTRFASVLATGARVAARGPRQVKITLKPAKAKAKKKKLRLA